MDIKIRIWAENDEFPEGKMYYPNTMHDEADENRGFFMNQSGDILHGRLINTREATWTLLWARIGSNNVTKMLGSGIKDMNDKEIYACDVITYWWSGIKIGAVSFDEGCFHVDGRLLKNLDQEHIIIHGNTLENPELVGLKKEEVSE